MNIEKLLLGIKKNVLLKNYTTFKIGGRAKYFFEAKTKEEIIGAINWAKELKLPFFILGGGSNLLVSDKGYKGLVIKIQNPNSKIQIKSKFQNPKLYVDAGTPLALLVSEAAKNNLTGMEWAAGIPGTVGGAVCGNAGAFGSSMADVVKKVEAFDTKTQKITIFRGRTSEDCEFGYRESVFKKNKNLIILSAELELKKGDKEKIKNKIKEYLKYRKERQPLNFPSAGSVFKNPPLRQGFGGQGRGFSAGEMIDKCGLKGKKIGKVKISEKHANFIVNLGGGKAKDVIKLIKLVKKKVKNQFRVELKEEIQYLGFKN